MQRGAPVTAQLGFWMCVALVVGNKVGSFGQWTQAGAGLLDS
jgi:hypothetical protein